jgi:hypothetical protein
MCGCKYKENFKFLYNLATTNSFFSVVLE